MLARCAQERPPGMRRGGVLGGPAPHGPGCSEFIEFLLPWRLVLKVVCKEQVGLSRMAVPPGRAAVPPTPTLILSVSARV